MKDLEGTTNGVERVERSRRGSERVCASGAGGKRKMKNKKLKLYVWTDVLADYTSGLAVAVAHDEEEALKYFKDKGLWHHCIDELKKKKPKVVHLTKPYCVWVHGGG